MTYRNDQPACDMTDDCRSTVTHIDDKGFIYCTAHGVQRRGWRPCRKMRQHELNRIARGDPVLRY